MNNSTRAVTTSSTGTFTQPQACDYSPAWNGPADDRPRSNAALLNGYSDADGAGLECLDTGTVHDPSDGGTIQVPTQVDLGLWLLRSATIRKDQWERLHEVPRGATAGQQAGMKWPLVIKRSCDIVASLFVFTVLSPLFVLIAVLIKLDSPGPVFFRHHRVGKGRKEFLLWKFRSMKGNVPKYAVSPQSADDSRLTRVGRVIRRLSIDEIPQLINVIKGEMSLVGPRPEMPFIVDSYRSIEYQRFAVRPGITGLWQISPARAFPIHENIHYDLHYINNQNLMLDCAIILRTITAVMHGIGAV